MLSIVINLVFIYFADNLTTILEQSFYEMKWFSLFVEGGLRWRILAIGKPLKSQAES